MELAPYQSRKGNSTLQLGTSGVFGVLSLQISVFLRTDNSLLISFGAGSSLKVIYPSNRRLILQTSHKYTDMPSYRSVAATTLACQDLSVIILLPLSHITCDIFFFILTADDAQTAGPQPSPIFFPNKAPAAHRLTIASGHRSPAPHQFSFRPLFLAGCVL